MKKIETADIEEITALTPLQEGMLFHYLQDPDTHHYCEQLRLTLRGDIRPQLVSRAWQLVSNGNEAMRSVFHWQKQPLQIILKHYPVPLICRDLTASAPAEKETQLQELIRRDRDQRHDLSSPPVRITLCLLTATEGLMIISNHHILWDGWSTGLLLSEFFTNYNALITGKTAVRPNKKPYKSYVTFLQKQNKNAQQTFWQEYLKDLSGSTRFSIKPKITAGPEAGIDTGQTVVRRQLSPSRSRLLLDSCRSNKRTPAALFYTAWALLLMHYAHNPDVLFGTTVSGRDGQVAGIEDMVGLFINTVPFRLKAEKTETLNRLLDYVAHELPLRKEFETAAAVDIRGWCAAEGELYDSVLVLENYPLNSLLTASHPLHVVDYRINEATHYDVTVGITIEETITIEFFFKTQRFETPALQKIPGHLENILYACLDQPQLRVDQLDLLSEAEKQELLEICSGPHCAYPVDKTLHQLFEEHTCEHPGRIALIFGHQQVSYHYLNQQADAVARQLRQYGVNPGHVVALKVERSIEMPALIIGILKAGAAYLPIHPGYPEQRIAYMLKDSNAALLIEDGAGAVQFRTADGSELKGSLDLRGLPAGQGQALPNDGTYRTYETNETDANLNSCGNPAYIIYTSGTTGQPKGVLVDHAAVVNRIYWVGERYRLNEKDVVLQAANVIFDVSVCELFRWIPAGARLCLLPPDGDKDPRLTAETIHRVQATTADFVPSMLGLLLEQVEQLQEIHKLQSLRWVFTGVEIVGLNLVHRFNRLLHAAHGTILINAYGPTESTVDVTYYDCSRINADASHIPIGRPMGNHHIFILTPFGNLQPPGVWGELYIAGQGLSQGYLNRPELTAERFPASQAPDTTSYRTHRTYRTYKTGDLARYLPDGNLQFGGRIDQQVKIRGFRVELGEIESRLLSCPNISEAVVTALTLTGGTELCAYIVSPAAIEPDTLKHQLAEQLPDYMIPRHILQIPRLPLTPGGGIDRSRLPTPGTHTTDEPLVPPADLLEEQLLNIWAAQLQIEPANLGVRHNFFRLGGHSLKAVRIAAAVRRSLDIIISPDALFQHPTIRSLARHLRCTENKNHIPLTNAEECDYYPLTSAQERIYIHHNPDTPLYNMPSAWFVEGRPDIEKLETVFRQLIHRHHSLRTTFFIKDDRPVQRIHHHVPFSIQYRDTLTAEDPSRLLAAFVQPFQLDRAPLLRVALQRLSGGTHLLLTDMHHIISDGVSMTIFIRDFQRLYQQEELPPPPFQYKDYVRWETRNREHQQVHRLETFWQDRIKEGLPRIHLGLDYPRPAQWLDQGSIYYHTPGPEAVQNLRKLARQEETTLYVVLLAVCTLLFSRISGSPAVVTGTAVAGRPLPDLENIMGVFINTIVLRNQILPDISFRTYLHQVRRRTLEAFKHQEFPFEQLVKLAAQPRRTDRHPIFDLMFALAEDAESVIQLDDITLVPHHSQLDKAKFDLAVVAVTSSDRLLITFQYCTALFKPETMQRYAAYLDDITAALSGGGEILLKDIKIAHNLSQVTVETEYDDFDF